MHKPVSDNNGHKQELADWLGHRTLRASVRLSGRMATLGIVLGLGASWLFVHLAGGAGDMVPHWYYIPIFLAAARFGPLAAFIVALASAILAGPLTWDNVELATPQGTDKWLTRAGFFIGIGQLMAWIVRPALRPIGEEIRNIRQRLEISKGIRNGEFFLRYQPILSVADDRFCGAEALIRWQHPVRGELSPAAFIETAEDSDVIHEMTDFVIDEACRQASEWKRIFDKKNLPAPYIGVNISARDLQRREFIEIISEALDRHQLPGHLLHLELTERVLALEEAVFQLRRIKRLDVKLAADDFGTGYSSLSYLDRFPFDVLKLDRSLVSTLKPDPGANQGLAKGIIQIARSIGLETVAEGVETAAQFEAVRMLKFDRAQGYYFSRPVDASEAARLLIAEEPGTGNDDETGLGASTGHGD